MFRVVASHNDKILTLCEFCPLGDPSVWKISARLGLVDGVPVGELSDYLWR